MATSRAPAPVCPRCSRQVAHDELLALIDKARFKWWHDRRWGVKALAAMGKKAEAIRYAEDSRGLNDPGWQIAEACEAILLSSGLADEAYRRYAIEANQGTTNLATFRAIAKKYSHVPPELILRDLVASTPGTEGKWFAAAKDAGLFALAAELANQSPTDPRTLTRAARDFASRPTAVRHECRSVSAALDCAWPRLRDHRRRHPGHSPCLAAGEHAGGCRSAATVSLACTDFG
jgi:hypothetical protein